MQFVGRIKMSKNPFTKRATECSVPHSPPLSGRVRSDFVSSIRAHNCIIIYVFEGSLAEGCVEWRGEVKIALVVTDMHKHVCALRIVAART